MVEFVVIVQNLYYYFVALERDEAYLEGTDYESTLVVGYLNSRQGPAEVHLQHYLLQLCY